ncbi:hypothetical protein J6590_019464 [Homalodisca vitripennis]|nr:hypothetical protein J6590_019464 [Homalodisca vitripennis]
MNSTNIFNLPPGALPVDTALVGCSPGRQKGPLFARVLANCRREMAQDNRFCRHGAASRLLRISIFYREAATLHAGKDSCDDDMRRVGGKRSQDKAKTLPHAGGGGECQKETRGRRRPSDPGGAGDRLPYLFRSAIDLLLMRWKASR